ncbi:MAG: OmpA family protein [Gemmatimonadota bacterium]
MFARTVTLGLALLLAASPAASQHRGTIEFGAFGNLSSFDNSLFVDNAFGGGGRVGAFIFPRLSVEFDVGLKFADRPDGRQSVEVEAFAARLTGVPVIMGPLSILVGAGLIHTDFQDLNETDGGQVLLGAKLALGEVVSLRVDGLADFNNDGTRNQALQVGMSLHRSPATLTRTVTREIPAPAAAPTPQRPDSVSAAETARLRALEAEHRAMLAAQARAEADARSNAAMIAEVVRFAHDASDLSGEARAILDRKVTILQENPGMRIVVTGHTSEPGTDAYNLALGLRRADAVKAYLTSRGVAAARMEVATAGRREPVASGGGAAAQAANRRAEFRISVSGVN